jgi:hypothetical protein
MWPTRPKQRRRASWRARAFAVKRQSNTRAVAIQCGPKALRRSASAPGSEISTSR